MPALDPLTIWNLALSEIRAAEVASPDEQSLEARECRRHYPHVLAVMLEGPQDYGFAQRRQPLALLLTNDRSSEWAYAYALPANFSSAIRLLPSFDEIGRGVPIPLSGDPYAETFGAPYIEAAYEIDADVLYANVIDATLEYVRSDVSGARVPQLVIDALSYELAARLAVPIKGDSNMKKELMGQAEMAWQRAIAADRNRQPEQWDYVPESIAARHLGAF